MSFSPEPDPGFDKVELARTFLEDVFPDAVAFVPAELPGLVGTYMETAGFGVAEVLLPDGSTRYATFICAHTPHTRAIEQIWEDEQAGILPEGSHERAIDSIISGTFEKQWNSYLT